jgi:chromosome segregation ATPase
VDDQRTTRTGSKDSSVALDRRRTKMQSAKAAAATAAAAVDALDQRLAANAHQHGGHEADLQTALDRVESLRKSIKTSTRERKQLRIQRKDAGRAAAGAHDRARRAEAKYDTAMLADLLRREKDNDLSAHGEAAEPQATPSQAGAPTPSKAAPTPSAEPEATPTQSPATRTAARTTAQRAGAGPAGRRRQTVRSRSTSPSGPSRSNGTGSRTDGFPPSAT